MKLIEALEIAGERIPHDAESFDVLLATGFTAMHLQTFLAAYVRLALRNRRVNIQTGLYGNLARTLEDIAKKQFDAAIVAIEWPDLDPRLGFRNSGGWGPDDLADIVKCADARARRIANAIGGVSGRMPIAISLPTLPLPPVSSTAGYEFGSFDAHIRRCVSSLACELLQYEGVHIANSQRLDRLSAPSDRLDLKSELLYGFPYHLHHAAVMAEQLASLAQPRLPKKGLIIDLDNTLWSGIVGECGANGVSWDLNGRSQMHGVFQIVLRSLAESGVLIAAASKNDLETVTDVFKREDVLLPRKYIFPMEVHWKPKSESVVSILASWNIDPSSAVFVDDSAMEVCEVQTAFPALECIRFPTGNEQSIVHLCEQLRDLFGKSKILAEDRIRLQSIRNGHHLHITTHADAASRQFLNHMNGEITLDWGKTPFDSRAFELVNKTNQFNLNGNRHTQSSWIKYLQDPAIFLLVASYKDRFGPLGKIAVITGHSSRGTLFIENWVMSCRAFTRQIEYQCLEQLFKRFGVNEVVFNFSATTRNGPLQEFFSNILSKAPEGTLSVSRKIFKEGCPELFHIVKDPEIETSRVL